MIEFNRETRQQKRNAERERVKSGAPSPQQILNTILWRIIMQNGGALCFSASELEDVPLNVAFNLQAKDDQIRVIAGTQQPFKKSPLVLPDEEIKT